MNSGPARQLQRSGLGSGLAAKLVGRGERRAVSAPRAVVGVEDSSRRGADPAPLPFLAVFAQPAAHSPRPAHERRAIHLIANVGQLAKAGSVVHSRPGRSCPNRRSDRRPSGRRADRGPRPRSAIQLDRQLAVPPGRGRVREMPRQRLGSVAEPDPVDPLAVEVESRASEEDAVGQQAFAGADREPVRRGVLSNT